MIGNQPEANRANDEFECPAAETRLTAQELVDLQDSDLQAHYRREYLAQLRRRACPGCGEADEVF
jgi:hypothetical protein